MINYNELHKTGENKQLEFKESFGKETLETVVVAEAFYLRGNIEKFGTGFFWIQSELKHSPNISFKVESLTGFTRSKLGVINQKRDTPQNISLEMNMIGNLAAIMEGEMTRQEIQQLLKLNDRSHFRVAYLKPALGKGLIEMTIPGKPNRKYKNTG